MVVCVMLLTGDIEDADLSEHRASSQRREHRHAVVRDDRQLTSLDDVQLLADVALPAHVVAGTTDIAPRRTLLQVGPYPCSGYDVVPPG